MIQGTYTTQAERPGQQLDKGRKGGKNVMYCGGRKQTSRGGCRGLCSRLRIKLTSPMCIPSGHLLVIQRLMAQTAWFIDPSQHQHQGRSPSARPQESGLAKASRPMGGCGMGGAGWWESYIGAGFARREAQKTSNGVEHRQPEPATMQPAPHSRVTIGQWGGFRLVRHSWGLGVIRVATCMSIGPSAAWDD